MIFVFYISAAVAISSTLLVITRTNAVHALLFLILSFLAMGLVFYSIGAPFIAALEVIIYAGAIMVLFLFVIMLLNLGRQAIQLEKSWMERNVWISASMICMILLVEVAFIVLGINQPETLRHIEPQTLSLSLFGPYLLGVELASILLLTGIVGAFHLGRKSGMDSEQHIVSSKKAVQS